MIPLHIFLVKKKLYVMKASCITFQAVNGHVLVKEEESMLPSSFHPFPGQRYNLDVLAILIGIFQKSEMVYTSG